MAAILVGVTGNEFCLFFLNHTHFIDSGRIRREGFTEL